MYTANLANNILYRDTPTSSKSSPKKVMRESQFMDSHVMRPPQAAPKLATYQGMLNLVESDDSDDWDSEPELEVAKVQEASRVQRRIPSIRNTSTQPKQKSYGSPYYCEEIGPQLDLGYQWPRNTKKGFVKYNKERYLLDNKNNKAKKNLLLLTTVYLKDTFTQNNAKIAYKVPKRILTKPSKPFRNEENDNENYDYILKVNEILGHDPNYQYRVIDILGQGTFGQVVKCERVSTGELFSVKVIKNKSAYKTQSCMEIEILKKLNRQLDPEDKHHILRLFHVFTHKHHLCLVFELLSYNLYDLIGHNSYKGFPPETVRAFAVQILDTLCLLKEAKIIHCDLKPENILLQNEKSLSIKVIDFGSSCHEANRIYTYIQSRFYRSPEVLLGMRYTGAIDMWSFGCIVAELFLGLPLFPGSSEYNQLFRIVEMLGIPSKDMLSKGRNTKVFFNRKQVGDDFEYDLKSREQYSQENNKNELPRKKYFPHTTLKDIILKYNHGKPSLSKEEEKRRNAPGSLHYLNENEIRDKEKQARLCILDFLYGVLELNPLKRWTPQQALQHPFITQKPFTGPFKPNGHIRPVASTSTGLSGLDPNNSKPTTRRRAESLGRPTAPEQIQMIAQQIHSPIAKYQPETYTKPSENYRQRNTKSQGDDLGLLSPEAPKKVKISNHIKIGEDSVCLKDTTKSTLKKSHAGEAAGGLLMLRYDDDSQNKRSMSDTFKRRTIK